jgi:hypothetical protein
MAQIVSINCETPLEFITRNGPTLIHEIVRRFGTDIKMALQTMKALERRRLVQSCRVAFEHGAALEWSPR